MYMDNKHTVFRRLFGLIAGILFLFYFEHDLFAETRLFSFTTSKGLTIKVLQDNEMPFINAQLLVFLDASGQDYSSWTVSRLTLMNMFERELNSPPSNLLDLFFKMGNDYQVEQNPEYLKISLNILPDRLSTFTKLLKEMFSYRSFHLKKFYTSKEKYWSYFTKNRDWKKEIAFLLAYQHFISNFIFIQSFSNQELLNKINLVQLRSFYLKTFRPDNSLLILKGKVHPYIALGLLEKDLPLPIVQPLKTKKEAASVNVSRKVLIVNVNSADLPMIYCFDVTPMVSDADHLPYLIGNFTLFGFPNGRIYQSEKNQFQMGNYKVSSEIYSLRNFSVFCNYLRVNYNDIENFLLLVDQERKKYAVRPIERKEYLDALNYYLGQAQVETGRFDYGVQMEIDRFQSQPTGVLPLRSGPRLFQEVSFNRVLQVLDEQMGYKHKAGTREKGIIVLIGNANLILSSLKIFKANAVELSLE